MYVLERTHRLTRDLDWVPRGLRNVHWLVAGVVGGAAALSFALLDAGLGPLFFAAFLYATGGDQARRHIGARVRQRYLRLEGTEIPIDTLAQIPDGQVVRVRGRVQADEVLRGIVHGARGVFRRALLRVPFWRYWVHEAAIDFHLADTSGRVLVHAAGARLLAPFEDPDEYQVPSLRASDSPQLRELAASFPGPIHGREYVLAVSTEVEIVGVKSSAPDAEGPSAGYREMPTRPILTSSREQPLLIRPVVQ